MLRYLDTGYREVFIVNFFFTLILKSSERNNTKVAFAAILEQYCLTVAARDILKIDSGLM